MTMAEDLKNAKFFLQQGLLTAETLDNFDLWKEDIVRAVKSVSLTGPEHWATINQLIYNWLDDGNYQTISSFIPNNYDELWVIDPAELLQRIEARLVMADQLEYKKLRFELARQKATENPWKFEHRLTTYYREPKLLMKPIL